MTLTPSVRATSLCNFPCVTNSFACASFVAISALECLFFLAIDPASDHAANSIAALLQGNALFPCRSLEGRLAMARTKKSDEGNHCRAARLTCVVSSRVRGNGM